MEKNALSNELTKWLQINEQQEKPDFSQLQHLIKQIVQYKYDKIEKNQMRQIHEKISTPFYISSVQISVQLLKSLMRIYPIQEIFFFAPQRKKTGWKRWLHLFQRDIKSTQYIAGEKTEFEKNLEHFIKRKWGDDGIKWFKETNYTGNQQASRLYGSTPEYQNHWGHVFEKSRLAEKARISLQRIFTNDNKYLHEFVLEIAAPAGLLFLRFSKIPEWDEWIERDLLQRANSFFIYLMYLHKRQEKKFIFDDLFSQVEKNISDIATYYLNLGETVTITLFHFQSFTPYLSHMGENFSREIIKEIYQLFSGRLKRRDHLISISPRIYLLVSPQVSQRIIQKRFPENYFNIKGLILSVKTKVETLYPDNPNIYSLYHKLFQHHS